jgi:3'-phosphoadenosine 5'-phosphosulfate sulfotransferase (PAPS reductase)/FAD synthetase
MDKIQALIDRGAIFWVNHSGGKDSQAMMLYILGRVPVAQIRVVHAVLPEVDWEGVEEHIRATVPSEIPIETCRSRRTLLQMIEERGMFPSPKQRQCTSDLKRGPIERTIRGLIEERIREWVGAPAGRPIGTEERKNALAAGMGLVVNCMGMRAEESSKRAQLETFKLSERNSKNGREWYEWLPIHDMKVDHVFRMISAAGQRPHWAYEAGMTRLSCCFCIMASKADLTTAARLKPELYRRYVELERSTGQVMIMPSKTRGRQSLEQITGIPAVPGSQIVPVAPGAVDDRQTLLFEDDEEATDEAFA